MERSAPASFKNNSSDNELPGSGPKSLEGNDTRWTMSFLKKKIFLGILIRETNKRLAHVDTDWFTQVPLANQDVAPAP